MQFRDIKIGDWFSTVSTLGGKSYKHWFLKVSENKAFNHTSQSLTRNIDGDSEVTLETVLLKIPGEHLYPFPVYNQVLNSTWAKIAIDWLMSGSAWFEVVPLPDGFHRITIKKENQGVLDDYLESLVKLYKKDFTRS